MTVKVNVDTKVRLTATGQTSFVRKVVIGTPVRAVSEDAGLLGGLTNVNDTGKSNLNILYMIAQQQTLLLLIVQHYKI